MLPLLLDSTHQCSAVPFSSEISVMGAFLFIVVLLLIGAGVAYHMGYLNPYIEQLKQQMNATKQQAT